jgi:hypothetical protein
LPFIPFPAALLIKFLHGFEARLTKALKVRELEFCDERVFVNRSTKSFIAYRKELDILKKRLRLPIK